MQIPFVFLCLSVKILGTYIANTFLKAKSPLTIFHTRWYVKFQERMNLILYIYCESSVFLDFFLNSWFECVGHNWRSARAFFIMNIHQSTIKHNAPFPNRSFIHHITANLVNLSENFDRSNFFCIHKPYYTTHLSIGVIFILSHTLQSYNNNQHKTVPACC